MKTAVSDMFRLVYIEYWFSVGLVFGSIEPPAAAGFPAWGRIDWSSLVGLE